MAARPRQDVHGDVVRPEGGFAAEHAGHFVEHLHCAPWEPGLAVPLHEEDEEGLPQDDALLSRLRQQAADHLELSRPAQLVDHGVVDVERVGVAPLRARPLEHLHGCRHVNGKLQ